MQEKILAIVLLLAAASCVRGQGCWVDQWGQVHCQPQQVGWQSVQTQQQRWQDNRVVYLDDGGTASFIDIDGRVFLISCAHESARSNVQVGQRLGFRCNDGSTSYATVQAVDPQNDVSILLPHGTPGPQVKPFKLSETQLTRGEQVWVAGFPMGRPRVRISAVIEDTHTLVLSGGGTPGESGGPIINRSGRLVGVLFGDETGANRSLCCGRGPIRNLIRQIRNRLNPRPQLEPVQPIPPPTAEAPPHPPEPQPDIDYEDWENWQQEIKTEQQSIRNELSVLIQNIQSIKGEQGPAGPQGPPGPAATQEFHIRVRNPKTGAVSPYATVRDGQYVTLDLAPVD